MAEGINKKQQLQKKLNGAYYKLQFGRTDDNKKRKLRRHLRRFPEDAQTREFLAQKFPSLLRSIEQAGIIGRAIRRLRRQKKTA